ncbi:MAG: serine hydrolase, partial [Akkermansiaceae bacterium]|nr:serine hydrolase [Armatimonadota bacterium]
GGGILGVCAVGSASGETVSYNAGTVFPTASVIKAAIVAEMWAQIGEGTLAPDMSVTSGADDRVAGSGVLADLEPGHSFTLAELSRLAISVSDNTASNAVLRAVGGPGVVNRRMRETWGMTDTVIHRPIRFHLTPDDPSHTATGTPADMCRFMHAVATGTLHSPAVCERMMALLAMCDDTAMLPRYLEVNAFADDLDTTSPPFTVHHKPGAVTGVRNDAGVVRRTVAPFGHVALAVYTKGVADPRWTVANRGCEAVAKVAELLVERLL